MAKSHASPTAREITPVDDVRRIREQFDREAGGDIRRHAEQTRLATEKWIRKLGLKWAKPAKARRNTPK